MLRQDQLLHRMQEHALDEARDVQQEQGLVRVPVQGAEAGLNCHPGLVQDGW